MLELLAPSFVLTGFVDDSSCFSLEFFFEVFFEGTLSVGSSTLGLTLILTLEDHELIFRYHSEPTE